MTDTPQARITRTLQHAHSRAEWDIRGAAEAERNAAHELALAERRLAEAIAEEAAHRAELAHRGAFTLTEVAERQRAAELISMTPLKDTRDRALCAMAPIAEG